MADFSNNNPERYYGDPTALNVNSWGPGNSWGNPNLGYPVWNGNQFVGSAPGQSQLALAPAKSIVNNEELSRLSRLNSVDYKVTPDEMARYMCDHKDADAHFLAKVNQDNLFYCPRCGRTFMISQNGENIENDILAPLGRVIESIKLLNAGNVSVDVIRALVMSYAILDKGLKQVYEITFDQWEKSLLAGSQPFNNGMMYPMYGYGNVGNVMTNIRDAGAVYNPYGNPYAYGMYGAPQGYPQQMVPNYPVGNGYPYANAPMAPQQPVGGTQVVGNPFDSGGVYNNPYTNGSPYGMPQQPMLPNVQPNVANITTNPIIPGGTNQPIQQTAVQIPPAMAASTPAPQQPVQTTSTPTA